jgi:ubiquinol-cytochrome c reductase iron-sulfur subunit
MMPPAAERSCGSPPRSAAWRRPVRDSPRPGWPGVFYCPCHGSKFDLAGWLYRGSPAPTNRVIPPHRYDAATRLVVGADDKA